jgi:transcriptional regulator with XRE-family HTH domain
MGTTGKKVKKAVQESGMTQTEVAEKAGMSKRHLHKIKTGLVDPSVKALARIGHVVGQKLSDLKKRNGNGKKGG